MIVLGLGANMESRWGTPALTIKLLSRVIETYGIAVKIVSPLHVSAPLGVRAQPDFVNAAALVETALGADALLRVLKHLEREAGRVKGQPWGPRPLDIDILDYRGRVMNWPARRPRALAPAIRRLRAPGCAPHRGPRPHLVLPHPQLHLREFVLAPLADIAPRWHHPVTGETVAHLLRAGAMGASGREGSVLRVLPEAVPG